MGTQNGESGFRSSGRPLRRKDLKPKREPTDAQLLAAAERAAARAAASAERRARIDAADRANRTAQP